MLYPLFVPGRPNGNTKFLGLPEGVLSLQGLPRAHDTRGKEYATYIAGKDFDTEDAMRNGVDEVILAWTQMLNAVLESARPTGIEWRKTPVYEASERPHKGKWRAKIYARFSLHGAIDEEDKAA